MMKNMEDEKKKKVQFGFIVDKAVYETQKDNNEIKRRKIKRKNCSLFLFS